MGHRAALTRAAIGAACAATLALSVVPEVARADSDSCREWKREHCDWKAEAMRRTLRGAPQPELDLAVFEMLQREAYLTSCEESAQASRAAMVGWRLVDRTPDEYGTAILEAVLERSGFDMDLRSKLAVELAPRPRHDVGPGFTAATNGAALAPTLASRAGHAPR